MRTVPDRDIGEWLAAEQAGDAERAERALSRVMAHVAREEPSSAFADAVLRASGFGVAAVRRWSPWTRLATLVCLVAAGLSAATIPAFAGWLRPLLGVLVADSLASLWHVTVRAAALAFESWHAAADAGAVVRAAAGSATGIVVLLANVLVAVIALIGLKRLLGAREELAQC
jgi:hypothetical protein